MDFSDQLYLLASRIKNTISLIQTEEATKNSMIMPMIQILGYNVFDPTEVTPELVADIGTKKGEKVDYAILQNGKPIVIFECKKAGEDLRINHASQLFRYFHVTEARFAILTNGLKYQFFTDTESPNKMDEKPFFEFNILDFGDRDVAELKKFSKLTFDVDLILNTANELKVSRAIQQQLSRWLEEPSEDFVRLVAGDLLSGRRFTAAVKDQYTQLTARAFGDFISEKINERLKVALSQDKQTPEISVASSKITQGNGAVTSERPSIGNSDNAAGNGDEKEQVHTSSEELEGYYIVKSMLRGIVNPQRIFMRDAQTYCAILLDDNNRKPICRLRFNNLQKLVVGFFDSNKEEVKISLSCLDELYEHADKLKIAVQLWEKDKAA